MRRRTLLALACTFLYSSGGFAQDSTWHDAPSRALDQVIVTGNSQPTTLRQSVFQVRVIDRLRIEQRAATSILSILTTELGIRWAQDNATGTADIQLMGMAGRNVKILLDGVPLPDRGDMRESLLQIDPNTLERIEIVEGPLSVMYGTDALAGVINLITKKTETRWGLSYRLQEETVGREYQPVMGSGQHIRSLQGHTQWKRWTLESTLTQQQFGGWQGDSDSRRPAWLPKNQWFSQGRILYQGDKTQTWFRSQFLYEQIEAPGAVNELTKIARDQSFITYRWMHQGQFRRQFHPNWTVQVDGSFTDYYRRTLTTQINTETNIRTLSLGQGEQDIAEIRQLLFRPTLSGKFAKNWALQTGLEGSWETMLGQRIAGQPQVTDIAWFVMPTFTYRKMALRPGFRVMENSQYNAPPVIPSLHAKWDIGEAWQLRTSYARGFRAPSLRELYFQFFDASHSIKGNPNLEAEYSHNYQTSTSWTNTNRKHVFRKFNLNGFFNQFENLITYGQDPTDPSVSMTVNLEALKTAGITWETFWGGKSWDIQLGIMGLARENLVQGEGLSAWLWTPEINLNGSYQVGNTGWQMGIFYKYTGARPQYVVEATGVRQGMIDSFQWMDVTVQKKWNKGFLLQAGLKNLFNITDIRNTTGGSGVHAAGPSLPTSYGRSYFIGITHRINS
ncbi:MAG: TonB-dependent receptor plug domain-containing protein [Spirosomataceae bacterium]